MVECADIGRFQGETDAFFCDVEALFIFAQPFLLLHAVADLLIACQRLRECSACRRLFVANRRQLRHAKCSQAARTAAYHAVRAIAAGRADLWGHLVEHHDERRVYARIHRDAVLDAWLICWTGRQDTGLHDHDLSSGAVRVVDGALTEDRLVMGEPGVVTSVHTAGAGFCFDSSRIHDVRNGGAARSVSLHLYYFTPRVRWIPTYRLEGIETGKPRLDLQAEILNDLGDLGPPPPCI